MASKRKPEEAVTPIEIRERVAREVMGLPNVRLVPNSVWPLIHEPTPEQVAGYGKYGVAHEYLPVPAYETDIAAAFQVVEEMRERGYLGFEFFNEGAGGGNEWCAEFWCRGDSIKRTEYIAHGATAPLAICLAALAALEAK